MNTPTPETDAETGDIKGDAYFKKIPGHGDFVTADFARKLERERDAAIKARNHNRVCVERLVYERNEYKKLLAETLKSDMPVVERLLLERNQLRKVCDELASDLTSMHNTYGYTSESLSVYNSLPHVIAAKKGNKE